MSGHVVRKRARKEAGVGNVHEKPSVSGPSADGCGHKEVPDMVHDAEFWFNDGNIILTAQDVAFKVYKEPLVRHSPVFSDMLSFPQPEGEHVNPCPVVALPDPACDLRHMLRALVTDKNIRATKQPAGLTASTACARLGHKYQIDRLVDDSLRALRKIYPDDFNALRKVRERAPPPTSAITVVNLARLTGADYLLPVALAECCRLGAAIVHGVLREDGSREYLGPVDLGLCFQAKGKLIEARVRAVTRMLHEEVLDDCEEDGEDVSDVQEFFLSMLDGTIPGLCTAHVWESILPLLKTNVRDLCSQCKKAIKLEEIDQQQLIFEELPSLVGVTVDGWCTNSRSR